MGAHCHGKVMIAGDPSRAQGCSIHTQHRQSTQPPPDHTQGAAAAPTYHQQLPHLPVPVLTLVGSSMFPWEPVEMVHGIAPCQKNSIQAPKAQMMW